MKLKSKKPSDSLVVMTEIVLPNDTNLLGNLMGGRILHWMDIGSAICAGKHAEAIVVTVSVDGVSFQNPIKLGDVLTITSKVTRAFSTSMEVFIVVTAEHLPSKTKYKCNEAFYTFVALDSNGKPMNVPQLLPKTKDEEKLFQGSIQRREMRLMLAGKMAPNEAKTIQKMFL